MGIGCHLLATSIDCGEVLFAGCPCFILRKRDRCVATNVLDSVAHLAFLVFHDVTQCMLWRRWYQSYKSIAFQPQPTIQLRRALRPSLVTEAEETPREDDGT